MGSASDRALEILRESLGQPDAVFHEHQGDAISRLVEARERLLVVQRTGWGKSAVYFIATRLLRERGLGPCLIISPLLALMRNQVDAARRFGVRLVAINSANTQEENDAAQDELLSQAADAAIISPERLANPKFVEEVLRPIANAVSLIVIDEAHCISDWGHDFRPDYKRIVGILGFLPRNLPVLGTTATANQRVMDDVAVQLGGHLAVLRGRLTRESIRLQCISLPRKSHRLAWLAEALERLEGTGIIYVATKSDAELVTLWLKTRGVRVESYSGSIRGLNAKKNRTERLRREAALLNNEIKALVATSALGMGYDKPDLAFVIHFQSPGSVVSYYQQVGRAGRAIPLAYGILLTGAEDDDIQQYFIRNSFPDEALVEEILEVLATAPNGCKSGEIERLINTRPLKIKAALTFLAAESPAPILKQDGRYLRTLNSYQLPHGTIERVLAVKQHEWTAMQEYVAHDGCRMQFLAGELDDDEASACGQCDRCAPDNALPVTYSHETGLAAAKFLAAYAIEIPPRKVAGPTGFPQDDLPYRLGDLKHQPGRVLCLWGDAGWGEIARSSKRAGRLDPQLVDASAELIRRHWAPDPSPSWVTFVPSLRNPELVGSFARELARQLGLPCIPAVRKMTDNKPQKEMENKHFRCRNLDGVFEVTPAVREGPVLLVDDAVDSGWTFAVIAALLQRAGSGLVYPFAVMSTANSG